MSETQRLPDESNAMPAGAFSAVCDRPGLVPVEGFVWPMAMDAASPFVNGVLYSSTRLLAWSAIQRLPDGSNPMPLGLFSPVWVVAEPLFAKFDWPITVDAASPVESGAANSSTRLLL